MGNTGYTWSTYSAVQKSASDWTSDAIVNDASVETGDVTSINGKASAMISITASSDNVSVDGVVTVYILGDIDGTNYEADDRGTPFSMSFEPKQNETVRILVPVDPRIYKNFKVALKNNAGPTVTMSVKLATADIPLAS